MRMLVGLGIVAALGACSEAGAPGEQGRQGSPAVMEVAEPPSAPADAKSGDGPEPVKVAVPQLAYAYSLAFLLPDARIGAAQEAHRALCERMGPARCQLLALDRDAGQNRGGDALLKLRVAGAEARAFQTQAERAVADAGGRPTGTKVAAEDVSKAIVDTEARIRQRELLVARLTEILRTRTGKVAELVEAERSVAQAQEELDQARGWLTELRGRVAMSDFEIRYSAIAPETSPRDLGGQLGEAVTGSGSAFVMALQALLTLAIYLAPWVLLVVPLALLARRFRKRTQVAPQG